MRSVHPIRGLDTNLYDPAPQGLLVGVEEVCGQTYHLAQPVHGDGLQLRARRAGRLQVITKQAVVNIPFPYSTQVF